MITKSFDIHTLYTIAIMKFFMYYPTVLSTLMVALIS